MNKQNIIVHGLPPLGQRETISDSYIVDALNEKLNLNLNIEDIHDVYRLGKEEANKPIKVCLANMKIKKLIMGNKKKLAGTKIYINDDLPKELRIRNSEERKKRINKNKRLIRGSTDEEDSTTIKQANKKKATFKPKNRD